MPTNEAARLRYARMRLEAWQRAFVPSNELVPMYDEYIRAFRKLVRSLEKECKKQHDRSSV